MGTATRARTRARAWLIVLASAIIVIYGVFFITFLGHTGPRDADQFLVFHSLQFWNATMFGLAKQWTPLMCAGLSMAGEPQIPFMSLSICLSYLFGPFWGLKIAIPIYFSLGWVGAFLYAGLWFKSGEQRMLAASLFIGNGFFVCRVAYGHFDLVPFLVLPLILWILHSSTRGASCTAKPSPLIGAGWGLVTLLTGGLIAMVIDGSPVAIIHLLLWVGIYSLALSFWARSWRPTALMVCALLLAAVLDAGYLWPMVQAQAEFPRLTVDTFTSIFAFLWFALLPMRGKVLPANGNGHELSVFIGPVMAYFIWKYRSWIATSMPREMKGPLSVVTAVSLVLGMGSLRLIHIPTWLSPFDLLRSLPGFRSIGVTGRYWGFAVLPLSLCAAGALSRYAGECREGWRATLCLIAILALPLGFQLDTLWALWSNSPRYAAVPQQGFFSRGPENIDYVTVGEEHHQGEFISPVRGVSDCYDMDDFQRADIEPGASLVTTADASAPGAAAAVWRARFSSWSSIQLQLDCPFANPGSDCEAAALPTTRFIFQQAYHSLWYAPGCTTAPDTQGRLTLECPHSELRRGLIELRFFNALSKSAAQVSTRAWTGWLVLAFTFSVLAVGRREWARRLGASPATAGVIP